MEQTTESPRQLLTQADKDLDSLFHIYAQQCGLSDAALFILYVLLDEGEGCTQRDICRLWSYSRQTINSSLKKLEKDGLLRLAPLSGNRRNKGIFFTPAGAAFARLQAAPLILAEDKAYASMSREELAMLVSLSQKRIRLLQQELEQLTKQNNQRKMRIKELK